MQTDVAWYEKQAALATLSALPGQAADFYCTFSA